MQAPVQGKIIKDDFQFHEKRVHNRIQSEGIPTIRGYPVIIYDERRFNNIIMALEKELKRWITYIGGFIRDSWTSLITRFML